MKLRIKRECGKCIYWAGFPYVHCTIGAEIHNYSTSHGVFISRPANPIDCRNKRQAKIEEG